jgi:hypothetical protein
MRGDQLSRSDDCPPRSGLRLMRGGPFPENAAGILAEADEPRLAR